MSPVTRHPLDGTPNPAGKRRLDETALAPEQVQAALRELVAHAELLAIDIVQQEAARPVQAPHEGLLPRSDDWTTAWQLGKTLFPRKPSATGTTVLVEMTATWSSDEVVEPLAHARARARVAYAFRDLEQPPHPQVLAAFADDLGLHHAWPFLRERLHTLGASMGLPPVVLPLRKR